MPSRRYGGLLPAAGEALVAVDACAGAALAIDGESTSLDVEEVDSGSAFSADELVSAVDDLLQPVPPSTITAVKSESRRISGSLTSAGTRIKRDRLGIWPKENEKCEDTKLRATLRFVRELL